MWPLARAVLRLLKRVDSCTSIWPEYVVVRHVLGHHRVRSYHSVPADGYATDHDRSGHDACAVFDNRVPPATVTAKRDVVVNGDVAANPHTLADYYPDWVWYLEVRLDRKLRRD